MLGNLAARDNSTFPQYQTTHKEAMISGQMFFLHLCNSSMNFQIGSFGLGSYVSDALTSFPRFVPVQFKIMEDGVWVGSCFLFWQNILGVLVSTLPFLDDAMACCVESSIY